MHRIVLKAASFARWGKHNLHTSQRGIGIVEVLIGIGIIGVIAVAFFGGLSTGAMSSGTVASQSIALSLAQDQMEYVRSQQYIKAFVAGVTGAYVTYPTPAAPIPAGFSILSESNTPGVLVPGMVGVPWDTSNNTAAGVETNIQRIKLVIEQGTDQVLTLTTYKANNE